MQFVFANLYGLVDVPKEALESVRGRDVIDGGGYIGDTAMLFYHLFDKSRIYAFEPGEKNFKLMQDIVSKYKADDRIELQKLALSDRAGTTRLFFREDELIDAGASVTGALADSHKRVEVEVPMDSIDNFAKAKDLNLGLIKLDVEGAERAVLHGAEETVRKCRPIIIAAVYHTPEDFFEMKVYLESLNLGYKFMLRRSELTTPMADLVLIAY